LELRMTRSFRVPLRYVGNFGIHSSTVIMKFVHKNVHMIAGFYTTSVFKDSVGYKFIYCHKVDNCRIQITRKINQRHMCSKG